MFIFIILILIIISVGFIYYLLRDVDCEGEWKIDEDCNHENKQKQIYKINKTYQNNGKPCEYSDNETRLVTCDKKDCEIGEWIDNDWSLCELECGEEYKQKRMKINSFETNGGKTCLEMLFSQGQDPSKITIDKTNKTAIFKDSCGHNDCPINCKLGEFINSDWSICSSVCESGKQVKKLQITTLSNAFGKSCEDTIKDNYEEYENNNIKIQMIHGQNYAIIEKDCEMDLKCNEYATYYIPGTNFKDNNLQQFTLISDIDTDISFNSNTMFSIFNELFQFNKFNPYSQNQTSPYEDENYVLIQIKTEQDNETKQNKITNIKSYTLEDNAVVISTVEQLESLHSHLQFNSSNFQFTLIKKLKHVGLPCEDTNNNECIDVYGYNCTTDICNFMSDLVDNMYVLNV